MANETKVNSVKKAPINESYKNNGTQTPVFKKPMPMPQIKPAKPTPSKK